MRLNKLRAPEMWVSRTAPIEVRNSSPDINLHRIIEIVVCFEYAI